jgi:hypothetical protein
LFWGCPDANNRHNQWAGDPSRAWSSCRSRYGVSLLFRTYLGPYVENDSMRWRTGTASWQLFVNFLAPENESAGQGATCGQEARLAAHDGGFWVGSKSECTWFLAPTGGGGGGARAPRLSAKKDVKGCVVMRNLAAGPREPSTTNPHSFVSRHVVARLGLIVWHHRFCALRCDAMRVQRGASQSCFWRCRSLVCAPSPYQPQDSDLPDKRPPPPGGQKDAGRRPPQR